MLRWKLSLKALDLPTSLRELEVNVDRRDGDNGPNS